MKKQLLLALIPMLFLAGCQNDPSEPLPDPAGTVYTVKLTADNSTLTKDDSTEPIQIELSSAEDESVKYKFEITAPCYLNTKSAVANQIGVKPGAMIKSVSNYTVSKITVDYYAAKGQNFNVYNNVEHTGDPLEAHLTNTIPTDPDDGGKVYDFSVNSTGWSLFNHTEFNKPSLYYVLVTFTK